MGYYFGRPDVALFGFSSFFKKMSKERLNDADRFIEFVSRQGRDFNFPKIDLIDQPPWHNGMRALEVALSREERIYKEQLNMLRPFSDKEVNPQLRKFVEDHLLDRTTEVIMRMKIITTRLKRGGDAIIEYHVDRELGGFQDALETCTVAPHEAWGGGA